MKNVLIVIGFILISTNVSSQTIADNWYFGAKAGIRFTPLGPMALTDGELATYEGCASISDESGNLLFYTDGTEVWNRNHDVMPHANDLMGDFSSSQSAIVVPKPNSTELYYVFTVDAVENELDKGMRYTLIDMSLDNGLGDAIVEEKNIEVLPMSCEKVTAVEHGTLEAYWIIGHKWNTNSFYAFLLTENGLDITNPVISNVGEVINGTWPNAIGYMKVSPNGKKLAKANQVRFTIEIFDFDDNTGIVSNPVMDDDFEQSTYGLEFSGSSEYLYVGEFIGTNEGNIFQYDMKEQNPQGILDSKVKVVHTGYRVEALQLAPDNTIYVASSLREFLGRINLPDSIAAKCDYEHEAVNLNGRQSGAGLPPFIQSVFKIEADFIYEGICFGSNTKFFENCSRMPDSVLWNFGDPLSGINNTSKYFYPTHTFTSSGMFQVSLDAWIGNKHDVVKKWITISELPEIDLGNDTSFCENLEFEILADGNFASWLWSTGDTTSSIITDTAGLFWAEVSNSANCINRDSIYLEVIPTSYGQQELNICFGDSVFLQGEYRHEEGIYYDTLLSAFSCDSILETFLGIFDTSLFKQEMEICQGDSAFLQGEWQHDPGWYTDVFLNINGCDSTVNTHLLVGEIIHAFVDTSICQGDSVFLQGDYQKLEGVYYDTTVAVSGCDSVRITQLDVNPVYEMYLDTGICQGDSVFLAGSYRKTAGEYTESYISVSFCDSTVITNLTVYNAYNQQTEYNLCLGDSVFAGGDWQKEAGIFTDYLFSIHSCDSILNTILMFDSVPVFDLGNDTTLNIGESLWLNPDIPGADYLWQDGSELEDYFVDNPGSYWAIVSNLCGSYSDTIKIEYYLPDNSECHIVAPNAFSPNGDGLNDVFKPEFNCNLQFFHLLIYNRWGELIFDTYDQHGYWDGKTNGRLVQSGTYIWVLEYNAGKSDKFKNKIFGMIHLL